MTFFQSRKEKQWYEMSSIAKLKYTRKLLTRCDMSDSNVQLLLLRQNQLINSFANLRSMYFIRFFSALIFNALIAYLFMTLLKPYDLGLFLLLSFLYVILASLPLSSAVGEYLSEYLGKIDAEIDLFAISVDSHARCNERLC